MHEYRPGSNLSFVSKLIERVVANQLSEYFSANDLLPYFHSAYMKGHSANRSAASLVGHADGERRGKGHTTQSASHVGGVRLRRPPDPAPASYVYKSRLTLGTHTAGRVRRQAIG